jgi:hypothetical protein
MGSASAWNNRASHHPMIGSPAPSILLGGPSERLGAAALEVSAAATAAIEVGAG